METSSTAPDPARIHSLPLFSSFTLDECAELAARSHEREYETGRHVIHQGDGGYTFSVIESGTADVFVDDAQVRTVGPGDVLLDTRRSITHGVRRRRMDLVRLRDYPPETRMQNG